MGIIYSILVVTLLKKEMFFIIKGIKDCFNEPHILNWDFSLI
jgi:hypothetical protein